MLHWPGSIRLDPEDALPAPEPVSPQRGSGSAKNRRACACSVLDTFAMHKLIQYASGRVMNDCPLLRSPSNGGTTVTQQPFSFTMRMRCCRLTRREHATAEQ